MRAALLQGARIDIAEVPDPTPGDGQLLIAPHSTGICGSDLHVRRMLGDLAAAAPDAPTTPIIPGHEFAGEVVALGPNPDGRFQIGDLVTSLPFTIGANGPENIGLSPTFGGGLAELTVADSIRTIHLPDGLDTRLGAMCEPVAVAVHAFALGANNGPLVVVGAGPIGLSLIALAVIADRHPIIVIDPSPSRRAMATRLGADSVHGPGTPLPELLAGVGFVPSLMSPLLEEDPTTATVFECVGRPDVVASVLGEAPPHSRIVLAGACGHPIEMHPLPLTLGEISVEFSFAYRPHEFVIAAGHLQQHPELFSPLITSERPLSATEAAFDDLADEPEELKIIIHPGMS